MKLISDATDDNLARSTNAVLSCWQSLLALPQNVMSKPETLPAIRIQILAIAGARSVVPSWLEQGWLPYLLLPNEIWVLQQSLILGIRGMTLDATPGSDFSKCQLMSRQALQVSAQLLGDLTHVIAPDCLTKAIVQSLNTPEKLPAVRKILFELVDAGAEQTASAWLHWFNVHTGAGTADHSMLEWLKMRDRGQAIAQGTTKRTGGL